jgi:phosphatidylinositol kinase/protein kinase (PI-3  family)
MLFLRLILSKILGSSTGKRFRIPPKVKQFQAIIYALTAATKSKNSQRCRVARKILRLMAEERPKFVEQACMLSEEFIRCAILWHEIWHVRTLAVYTQLS